MADTKQPNLPGAYYGPPIPPQQDYRSVGRRRSFPCLNLLKFIVSIVVTLGVIVLVLWLVFRPNEIKVHVGGYTISQFDLSTTNNTLQYNLAFNVSVRNPNRRIAIRYDSIEAWALYDGSRFGYTQLPVFHQGHKNTTVLHPSFAGQSVLLGDGVGSTYSTEKGEGYYNVEVKLHARLRLKIWFVQIHHIRPDVECKLKLPVPGSSNVSFETTKCHVDY